MMTRRRRGWDGDILWMIRGDAAAGTGISHGRRGDAAGAARIVRGDDKRTAREEDQRKVSARVDSAAAGTGIFRGDGSRRPRRGRSVETRRAPQVPAATPRSGGAEEEGRLVSQRRRRDARRPRGAEARAARGLCGGVRSRRRHRAGGRATPRGPGVATGGYQLGRNSDVRGEGVRRRRLPRVVLSRVVTGGGARPRPRRVSSDAVPRGPARSPIRNGLDGVAEALRAELAVFSQAPPVAVARGRRRRRSLAVKNAGAAGPEPRGLGGRRGGNRVVAFENTRRSAGAFLAHRLAVERSGACLNMIIGSRAGRRRRRVLGPLSLRRVRAAAAAGSRPERLRTHRNDGDRRRFRTRPLGVARIMLPSGGGRGKRRGRRRGRTTRRAARRVKSTASRV